MPKKLKKLIEQIHSNSLVDIYQGVIGIGFIKDKNERATGQLNTAE